MLLSDARPNSQVQVLTIRHSTWRTYAVRLGIQSGSVLLVAEVLPNGPIIVRIGPSTVAIGRPLAAQIEVQPVNP